MKVLHILVLLCSCIRRALYNIEKYLRYVQDVSKQTGRVIENSRYRLWMRTSVRRILGWFKVSWSSKNILFFAGSKRHFDCSDSETAGTLLSVSDKQSVYECWSRSASCCWTNTGWEVAVMTEQKNTPHENTGFKSFLCPTILGSKKLLNNQIARSKVSLPTLPGKRNLSRYPCYRELF